MYITIKNHKIIVWFGTNYRYDPEYYLNVYLQNHKYAIHNQMFKSSFYNNFWKIIV